MGIGSVKMNAILGGLVVEFTLRQVIYVPTSLSNYVSRAYLGECF